jgi:hypothetical protein
MAKAEIRVNRVKIGQTQFALDPLDGVAAIIGYSRGERAVTE